MLLRLAYVQQSTMLTACILMKIVAQGASDWKPAASDTPQNAGRLSINQFDAGAEGLSGEAEKFQVVARSSRGHACCMVPNAAFLLQDMAMQLRLATLVSRGRLGLQL